jgi:hypothetical protein
MQMSERCFNQSCYQLKQESIIAAQQKKLITAKNIKDRGEKSAARFLVHVAASAIRLLVSLYAQSCRIATTTIAHCGPTDLLGYTVRRF